MKSNIIKSMINLGCIPASSIKDYYNNEVGRPVKDVDEAFIQYLKDTFCETIREGDKTLVAKKYKQVFDSAAEGYPTMAIGGGDGDCLIINKLASADTQIELEEPIISNFSYDEDEDIYVSGGDECKALYTQYTTDGDIIKGIYMIYGEIYRLLAGDGKTVINARQAASKVFDCLDCKYEAVVIMPKSYYGTLHMQNRLEIETLIAQQTVIFRKDITVEGIECIVLYAQR